MSDFKLPKEIQDRINSARTRDELYRAAEEAAGAEKNAYYRNHEPQAAMISKSFTIVKEVLERGYPKSGIPSGYGLENAVERVKAVEGALQARTPDELKQRLDDGYRHGLQVKGTAGKGPGGTYDEQDLMTRIDSALREKKPEFVPGDLGLREAVKRMIKP